MKRFFSDLVASVRNVDFYESLAREGVFSRALGHFALFVLIVSVLVSIVPVVRYGRMLSDPEKLDTVQGVLLDTYPDELELRIKDGVASSNVEEPYLVPFPDTWGADMTSSDSRGLVLIDTSKSLSLEVFREYDVPVVVSRTEVGFMEEDGSVQTQSFETFSDSGEMVVNEQVIAGALDAVIPILRPIVWGLLLCLPFLLFSSLFLGYLIYLLFGALLVLIIANIRGASYGYAQAYRASLYLIAVPMLYGVITSTWLFPEYRIPFLVSILLVVMTAGLIRKPKTGKKADAMTESGVIPSTPDVRKDESKSDE